MKVLVAQSCLTLRDPIDCGPPGSSVHGILQARTLERVAMPSSRGSSRPRDQTLVSCTGRRILYRLSRQGSPRVLLKRPPCFRSCYVLPAHSLAPQPRGPHPLGSPSSSPTPAQTSLAPLPLAPAPQPWGPPAETPSLYPRPGALPFLSL